MDDDNACNLNQCGDFLDVNNDEMESITEKNCRELLDDYRRELSGDVEGQASAWNIIYLFCLQNNMITLGHKTGIENIISILETLKIK